MTFDQTTANVLTDLLRELSSELDLHYDDEDLHALEPTMKTLRRAVNMMTDAGYKAPEVYHHIVGRFDRMTCAKYSYPTAKIPRRPTASPTGL